MPETKSTSPRLVRDLMTVGVATCAPETSIEEIVRLLLEKGLEEVVALEEGHNVGVVSQEDLVRAYIHPEARLLTAEQVMRSGVPSVPPDIPLTTAAQIMQDKKVRALYLTHHAGGVKYPAALISYRHLLRHLSAQDGDDLKDLGIQAERQLPLDAFFQRRDAARRNASKH